MSTNQALLETNNKQADELCRLRHEVECRRNADDGPSTSVEKRLRALEENTSEHSLYISRFLAVSVSALLISVSALMKSQNKD